MTHDDRREFLASLLTLLFCGAVGYVWFVMAAVGGGK